MIEWRKDIHSHPELAYQEKIIYLINIIFFTIAILRFYLPVITQDSIFILNLSVFILLSFIFIIYFIKFKNIENLLTLITGCIIFLPICFVDKPIHAIVMGVLMHYTQYISLTFKVYDGRKANQVEKINSDKFLGVKNLNFLIMGLMSFI